MTTSQNTVSDVSHNADEDGVIPESMQQVTYLNEEFGTWGFYGCEADIYDTQQEAYDAYLQTL